VDKFDSRIVFILAALLIALGICALMLANFRTMLLGSALIGLGTAAIMPLLAVMLAREFGSGSIGKVLGIAFTGVQISALAPVSVGLLRDIGGSYHLPLTVFAGLVGAGMLAILFYRSDAPPPARLPKGASAAVD
jgi:cyanate permease